MRVVEDKTIKLFLRVQPVKFLFAGHYVCHLKLTNLNHFPFRVEYGYTSAGYLKVHCKLPGIKVTIETGIINSKRAHTRVCVSVCVCLCVLCVLGYIYSRTSTDMNVMNTLLL